MYDKFLCTYSSEHMYPSFYFCFWDPRDQGSSFHSGAASLSDLLAISQVF